MNWEKILETGKWVITIVGTLLTWLFGTWSITLGVLIVFMVLDYLTGVLKGYVLKELSSDIGLKGLARKAIILVVLIVAVMLDRLMGNENWLFRTLVCSFYIANEGLSIIENAGALGVPIPKKILDALAQLKDEE